MLSKRYESTEVDRRTFFWKVQNYAKTIVKPNGPSQSWVAGHHSYDPTETGQAWTREFSIRNAHMIRILFVSTWGVKLQGMGSTED